MDKKKMGKYSCSYQHVYGMSLGHQIYFSQHQTAFNILILKSPVGVKELFFLFLCDLQAEFDVKFPGEDGGRERVFKVSICFDIRHIQDIVYNN